LPHPELLLRPLQTREAIRSSSLEGTYATPKELLLFAKHPRAPRSDDDPANSWLEVSNYSRALRLGYEHLQSKPFSLNLLKEMQDQLLQGVRGRNAAPGRFRKHQVHIGSDRRYVPPPPQEIAKQLHDFEYYMNDVAMTEPGSLDPLVRAFLVHYQFEAIHPFMDGNGRVGRALLALMIYRHCNHHMPWLYISAYFERYKDEYIDNLFRVSTHGDWARWVEFCLRATIAQADDAIRRCERLRRLRDQFHHRAGIATPRTHKIIESLFTVPLFTISDLVAMFEVSHPTARKDADLLVKFGILEQVPDLYPMTFYAPELFQIAYHDIEEVG